MFEDNRSPVQLSTQCPHCQTPLQADVGALQRSKGWARCGRCHYLFDAVAHTGIPTLAPAHSGYGDDTPTAAPQAPGTRQAVPQEPLRAPSARHAADPVQPTQPVQARQPVGPTHPSDSLDRVESPDPLEAEDPLAATDPLDSLKPSEPAQPAVPAAGASGVAGAAAVTQQNTPPEPRGWSWDSLAQAMDDAIPPKPDTAQAQPERAPEAVDQMSSAAANPTSTPLSAPTNEPALDHADASFGNSGDAHGGLLGSAGAPTEPQMVRPDGQDAALFAVQANDLQADTGTDAGADPASKRSGFSWWSGLTVVVLLLLAGLQLAYWQRAWLVARVPQLQPVAQQVCEQLGCSIAPIQDVTQLRILSSSVMRLYSGELQLDITVENTGDVQLGVPNIQVLLTDANDQVFMTHTVVPGDWAQAPQRLDAKRRYPVTVRWPTVEADATRMVGYRTQLRYAAAP
jgi:hypothetical protein